MLLVDKLRDDGIAMRGLWNGRHFGWTTDEELATHARESGAAALRGYNETGPSGWEITCAVDAEVGDTQTAPPTVEPAREA